MTRKEKAKELVDQYFVLLNGAVEFEVCKQCALITVDEIIEANPIAFDENENCIAKQWWKEVKTEIEKL